MTHEAIDKFFHSLAQAQTKFPREREHTAGKAPATQWSNPMLNEETKYEKQIAVIPGDGLDDYDDDGRASIIRGTKLKFTNDAEWETDDGTAIAADRELLVVEIIKVVQKWIDGLPAATRVLAAHEKFPDIDELNDEAPREEWCEKFGRKVGPWEKAYIVYLLDPETMQVYTFPTSSDGGGRAVRELREATRLARRVRGPGIYPRIRLTDVFMNTQFGGRQRPHFHIVGYETLGGAEEATLTTAEPKQIEQAKPKQAERAEQKASPAQHTAPKSRKSDPDFNDPLPR